MPLTDERDFDSLPEALRLALFDLARREEAVEGEMNLAQIADASGTPYVTAHRRLSVALLKLRKRAEELDL